jgi:hypothetical protein
MKNIAAGEIYNVDLGTSTLLAGNFDLPSHRIALKKFLLEKIEYCRGTVEKKRRAKQKTSNADVMPWVISLDQTDPQRKQRPI